MDRIEFEGELRVEESEAPLVRTAEYRHLPSGEAVSQLAAFAPPLLGMSLSVELHRVIGVGTTHVIIRNLGKT